MARKKQICEPDDPATDISTRLVMGDHDWLMENRGSKTMREKAHEVIEFYKDAHLKTRRGEQHQE